MRYERLYLGYPWPMKALLMYCHGKKLSQRVQDLEEEVTDIT
jgi:hypothetical protein